MKFEEAVKKIKRQKIEVWTESDDIRMAIELTKADAMQKHKNVVAGFFRLTNAIDGCTVAIRAFVRELVIKK